MLSDVITVQPAPHLRRAFAIWATEQSPKIRTASPSTFAVPPAAFTWAPEHLLVGALVDGHEYVPVADEEPEREAVPGEPLPELPESAYGPDSVPIPPPDFAPLEDAAADEEDPGSDDSDPSDPSAEDADGPHRCDDCARPFTSERGLATHRRQKHAEGA